MLSQKTWSPEAVLMLVAGLVLAFFSGSLAAELLRRFSVVGFKAPDDPGTVLAATLSFHGPAIVLGFLFLKYHDWDWRDVLGLRDGRWKRSLLLAVIVLAAVLPVMLGLKYLSELALQKMGWPVEDQRAVELFAGAKAVWLRVYLGLFAVGLAPVAEEFVFRGLLFSAAKKMGWPRCGWVGVSLLFALIHANAPTFLALFVFALALTWLYEQTGGLFAPIVAHSLFNAANLGLLLLAERTGHALP